MKRRDGVPVNIKYEPAKSLSQAARFRDMDEYTAFITGYYKPPDASLYMPQWIEISYMEVEENVQQVGNDREDSSRVSGL